MAKMLSQKLGEMELDGLITDITPRTEVRGKTIKQTEEETVFKRGTLFSLDSSDNKLVIFGTESETATPDCILCDDVTVDSSGDVIATVYTAGCFDPNKIITKDNKELEPKDYDALRKYGIVFKAASAAN